MRTSTTSRGSTRSRRSRCCSVLACAGHTHILQIARLDPHLLGLPPPHRLGNQPPGSALSAPRTRGGCFPTARSPRTGCPRIHVHWVLGNRCAEISSLPQTHFPRHSSRCPRSRRRRWTPQYHTGLASSLELGLALAPTGGAPTVAARLCRTPCQDLVLPVPCVVAALLSLRVDRSQWLFRVVRW